MCESLGPRESTDVSDYNAQGIFWDEALRVLNDGQAMPDLITFLDIVLKITGLPYRFEYLILQCLFPKYKNTLLYNHHSTTFKINKLTLIITI